MAPEKEEIDLPGKSRDTAAALPAEGRDSGQRETDLIDKSRDAVGGLVWCGL
jgi:hypothetical protein